MHVRIEAPRVFLSTILLITSASLIHKMSAVNLPYEIIEHFPIYLIEYLLCRWSYNDRRDKAAARKAQVSEEFQAGKRQKLDRGRTKQVEI